MRLNSLPLAAGQGAEILPLAGDASFRRYFRVVHGDRTRGADGRAAAARGSAAVRRGRRMAGSVGPERAGDPRPRPRPGPAAARRFRRLRGCARRSTTDPRRERELYELATDVLVHLHQHPPMPGLQAARPRPVARGAEAVHRLVLPGGRRWTSTPTAIARPGREVLEPVAERRPRPGHRASRLSCREHHAGRRAARASRISACSTSRTRWPAIRPTTSPRCSKTRAATCRRRSSGR